MSSGLSRTICRELTKFFLRFILTIVSLLLSIRTNRATLGLLGTLGSTLDLSEIATQAKTSEGYSEIFYGEGVTRGKTPVKSFPQGTNPENEKKLKDYINNLFEKNKERDKKFIEQKTDKLYRITYRGRKYMFDVSRLFLYEFFTDKLPRRVGLIELNGSNRGYQVYDTDLKRPFYWNGSSWSEANISWGSVTGSILNQTDLINFNKRGLFKDTSIILVNGHWNEKRSKDIWDQDDSRVDEERMLFDRFSLVLRDLGVDVRVFNNNFDLESVVRFKQEIRKI
jgi:hypothetical protein